MKIIQVRCPKCGKKMLYQAKSIILSDKRKACVYCGKSFRIKDNIVKF